MNDDLKRLLELSAVDAVTAMQRGELSSERYASALLDQAERLASLNAFRCIDHDAMLQAARQADKARAAGAKPGLLHGLPIPVKDSVNTKDLATTNGTRALENFRPREDAAVVKLLAARGALLMGKTNLHELSSDWTSNNLYFGAVRNPYDSARTPGGSSGGSAAAVAARMAPLAVAEDTLGSIRVPAAFCGLAGLRPTYGRYPNDGIMPLTLAGFDQVGPVARTVADLVLFDAALTAEAPALPPRSLAGVRLGLAPAFFWAGLALESAVVLQRALEQLRAAGATVVEADVPATVAEASGIWSTIIAAEMEPSIERFLALQGAGVNFRQLIAQTGVNTAAFFSLLLSNPITSAEHAKALAQREALKAGVAAHFAQHRLDALIFPPTLCAAPAQDGNPEFNIDDVMVPMEVAIGRNMGVASCGGMPGLVIPVGLTPSGLPVALEFDGLPGSDRHLLSIGLAAEQLFGRLPAPAMAN